MHSNSSTVTGICERCGQSFTTRRAAGQTQPVRFCSWACYKAPQISRSCERCGSVFTVPEWKIAQGKGRFCSRACLKAPPIELTCLQCGKVYSIPHAIPSRQFCSKACGYAYGGGPAEDRFWKRVAKSDGCWLWTGGKDSGGYGIFDRGHRRQTTAHRVAWELTHGPIDPSLDVCHHCDTPACVRPDHLFLGTTAENLADARAKGRMPTAAPKLIPTYKHRGENHGMAKLTADNVREIRARVAAGERRRVVAALFGIAEATVGDIVRRTRWGHIE